MHNGISLRSEDRYRAFDDEAARRTWGGVGWMTVMCGRDGRCRGRGAPSGRQTATVNFERHRVGAVSDNDQDVVIVQTRPFRARSDLLLNLTV